MSNKKAVVTEQHLYDIAGSIRKKLNVETTYKPSEMPEAIDSISGGVLYDVGDYFGAIEGGVTQSLNITLGDYVGCVAILVVMHRDTLTLDDAWELVHSECNNPDITDVFQYISIYKKKILQNNESYTIQQASSVRMCACTFYFASDPNLKFHALIKLDPSYSNYHYSIPCINKYTLCILSDNWAGPSAASISSKIVLNAPTINEESVVRMLAFINTSPKTVYVDIGSGLGNDALNKNRVHIYTIN